MATLVPAIFLDRDGTINIDHGYVHEIDNFEFIDGVIDAMRELKAMGYALVLVTNQSGIARGLYSEAQFETLTEWMDWSLADRDVDSYIVGDKMEDMQAGAAANVGTKVLVRTGKPVTPEAEKSADWVLNSLAELPAAIKKHQK